MKTLIRSFLLLILFCSTTYLSAKSKVFWEDQFVFKIANEVFSIDDLSRAIKEVKNLHCFYPDSLLVRAFKEELSNEKTKLLRVHKPFTKDQKDYFFKLLKYGKLSHYSKSQEVQINPSLTTYFYSSAKKNKCRLSSFVSSKELKPLTQKIIRLEIFVRSRFLPVERSGSVTEQEYSKAVNAANELIISIDKQLEAQVYW